MVSSPGGVVGGFVVAVETMCRSTQLVWLAGGWWGDGEYCRVPAHYSLSRAVWYKRVVEWYVLCGACPFVFPALRQLANLTFSLQSSLPEPPPNFIFIVDTNTFPGRFENRNRSITPTCRPIVEVYAIGKFVPKVVLQQQYARESFWRDWVHCIPL